MGIYDRSVQVKGEPNNVYRVMTNVVATHRYEITAQNPPVQLAASRGSKLVTLALGTADYEELNVTLVAAGSGFVDVGFHFNFPWKSLMFLTPSERRKHEEGDGMIDEFVRLVEASGPGTFSSPRGTPANACPACGAMNALNAAFCTACGRSLRADAGTAATPAACPACSARLSGTESFCPSCGRKIR